MEIIDRHTISDDDTFQRVAAIHYGDSSLYALIQSVNTHVDPDDLPPGEILVIPRPKVKSYEITTAKQTTFNEIAAREYGCENYQIKIRRENPALSNPIAANTVVKIPALLSERIFNAARERRKTSVL